MTKRILVPLGTREAAQAVLPLVASVARAYMLGLLGHSLLEVGARAFYAQQDARTPLRVTGIGLATFTVCALLLFRPLGAVGIALANSIGFTLEAVILVMLLRRSYPSIGRVGRPAVRAALGAAAACGVVLAVWWILPAEGFFAAATALGMGALVAIPFVMPELRELASL